MQAELDLTKVPAAAPPPGYTSNLVDPDNYFDYLLPTCIVAWAFTVPAVLVRLFTKLRVHGRLQYEDYVLTLALICSIVWTILLLVQPTKGAHIWDTSVYDLGRFAYWSNLIIVLYVPSILLPKWAILLQLNRIFSIQARTPQWWMFRSLIWISTLFYFIMLWVDIFQCVPREKIWNPDIPGRCSSITGILLATSFFNIILNICIITLPLIILQRLQISRRKKITVCAIFAVAGLGCISSIMRTIYSFIFASSHDMTHTIFPVAMWAVAEIGCMIFATTFPTMPLFITYIRGGRQAARKKTGYASKTLAAFGGDRNMYDIANNNNRKSMRVNTGRNPLSRTETRGTGAVGTVEPWDSIQLPAPVAMRPLERTTSDTTRTASRGTAETMPVSLGDKETEAASMV